MARVKNGTGKLECLEPFAVPSASSFMGVGGGLRLPDPCGAYVDLSCQGTAVCEDMEPSVTGLGRQHPNLT